MLIDFVRRVDAEARKPGVALARYGAGENLASEADFFAHLDPADARQVDRLRDDVDGLRPFRVRARIGAKPVMLAFS
jgi:hypothetical protein